MADRGNTTPFPPPPRRATPVHAVRYTLTIAGPPLAELHRAAEEEGCTAEELLHDIVLRWLLRRGRRRGRRGVF